VEQGSASSPQDRQTPGALGFAFHQGQLPANLLGEARTSVSGTQSTIWRMLCLEAARVGSMPFG